MTAMLLVVMYNVRDDVFHWAAPNWDFLRLKRFSFNWHNWNKIKNNAVISLHWLLYTFIFHNKVPGPVGPHWKGWDYKNVLTTEDKIIH